MTATLTDRIAEHGRKLLAIFPNATERDPVKLCKKLRRIEAKGAAFALRLCNGPEFPTPEAADQVGDSILAETNALLGNVHEYQPKTGAKCGCKRGVQRDNCPTCEGTGQVINFQAIRNRPKLVPVFLNRDPRGYALKIDDQWIRDRATRISTNGETYPLHTDWGGYGIIAPDLSEDR